MCVCVAGVEKRTYGGLCRCSFLHICFFSWIFWPDRRQRRREYCTGRAECHQRPNLLFSAGDKFRAMTDDYLISLSKRMCDVSGNINIILQMRKLSSSQMRSPNVCQTITLNARKNVIIQPW
jgi:hypothetical protein